MVVIQCITIGGLGTRLHTRTCELGIQSVHKIVLSLLREVHIILAKFSESVTAGARCAKREHKCSYMWNVIEIECTVFIQMCLPIRVAFLAEVVAMLYNFKAKCTSRK